MRRVAVIGNSGGGKSALARRLADKLAIPCAEIDALLWLPGWRLSPTCWVTRFRGPRMSV